MTRLLVNDVRTTIEGTKTFWHDLEEWFSMLFVGGDYANLATVADAVARDEKPTSIIRNASFFPPIPASETVPTISLLQDIFELAESKQPPQRIEQYRVMQLSRRTVFNSEFTRSRYEILDGRDLPNTTVIPLPVDFSLFEPGNAMGLQQALSLPEGCVCWIGAHEAAGHVKGFDTFQAIVRANPDIPFVAVFKDSLPEYCPPNLRMYSRVTHEELVKIIGACAVGLCTSRTETQHLAGIEMGACGLPLVTPPVGVYWNREDLPGAVVSRAEPPAYTAALRSVRGNPGDPQATRSYWKAEFDRPVIEEKWAALLEEIECSGQS